MTWFYFQANGALKQNFQFVATGYSGKGEYKNSPAAQNLHNEGPIPQGDYVIDAPVDTLKHGPYVMPLFPDGANEMFGRKDFLIHGDSIDHPGAASDGCIILGRAVREQIWDSDDHVLTVLAAENA